MKHLVIGLAAVGTLMIAVGPLSAKGGDTVIEKGRQVAFEYTLTIDGQVVESSQGRDPFTYTHGEGQIIPGLSRGLEGMKAGEEKHLTIGPEDAYGPINPSAFQEIPKARLPQGADLQVGTQLQASTADGKTVVVRVAELKEESAVLDFNHPLAGKTLEFDVKVLSIQ